MIFLAYFGSVLLRNKDVPPLNFYTSRRSVPPFDLLWLPLCKFSSAHLQSTDGVVLGRVERKKALNGSKNSAYKTTLVGILTIVTPLLTHAF